MRVITAFAFSSGRRNLLGEFRGVTHYVRSERSARYRASERGFSRARRLVATGSGAPSQ
jgi:hypothetical protein